VVRRDEHAPAGGQGSLDQPFDTAVHDGDGLFGGGQYPGMPHHIQVGQVDHGKAVPLWEFGQEGVGHLPGAHLGLLVIGGHLTGGRDEPAHLTGERFLPAAVQKVGDMGVFLGFGQPQLGASGPGINLAQHIGDGHRREGHRQGKGSLVRGHGGETREARSRGPRETIETVHGERPDDLSGPVGPEIEKKDRIAVAQHTIPADKHPGFHEFVGLPGRIGGLDPRHRIGEGVARTFGQGGVGQGHPVPTFVPVHGIVAADERGDAPAALLL